MGMRFDLDKAFAGCLLKISKMVAAGCQSAQSDSSSVMLEKDGQCACSQ